MGISKLNYQSRSPIIILKNSDFSSYNFPGVGSEEEPYLIENYLISDSLYPLIEIRNTNVYFRIANNFLDNINTGVEAIFLKNVVNGEIVNNTIVNSRHGIYLDNSDENKVINNSISQTSESGIRLNTSSSNIIIGNSISTIVHHGIWLNASSQNIIANNTISAVYNGLWLKSSSWGNEINGNYINETFHGIWISSSNDNLFVENYLDKNSYGFYLTSTGYPWDPLILCQQNDILNNTVLNNSEYGIYCDFGVINTLIKWNTFIMNNWNGSAQALDNGTNNVFQSNFWDDWTGPDVEPDGIVDDSYPLKGPSNSSDPFPLTKPINPTIFHFLSRPRVISPNGEEVLGGIINVEWSSVYDSQGFLITYSLYYSSDDGGLWTYLIITSETHYSWNTYPLLNGSEYLIKVIANNSHGFWTKDVSDSSFSLENPSHFLSIPTVNYPNSFLILSGIITVQWSPSTDSWNHAINYSIYYSNDNGENWTLLEEDLLQLNYQWDTKTVSDGSNYLVKVKAFCSSGLTTEDISDSIFEVRNTGHTLSSPIVINPNGGETLHGNISIQWQISIDSWDHMVQYRIYISMTGGLTWIQLAEGLNETVYNWDTTSVIDGANFKIRIIATCTEGLSSEDVSDDLFSIRNTAHSVSQITLLSPNGNEILNNTIIIQWSEVVDTWDHPIFYSVYYSSDNGITWIPCILNTTNTFYSWNTRIVFDGDQYLIKVSAMCSEGVITEDTSDNIFSIRNFAHSLTDLLILYPNKNIIVQGIIIVEWNIVNDSWHHNVNYSLSYSADGGITWNILMKNQSLTSYEWDTTLYPDGTEYMVRVEAFCEEGLSVEKISGTFTIQNTISTTTQTQITTTTTSSITTMQYTTSSTSSTPSDSIGGILGVLGLAATLLVAASLILFLRYKDKILKREG